jgi:hypothetical protein
MKHIKNFKLSERRIYKKTNEIGDYIFDKYIESQFNAVKSNIEDILPSPITGQNNLISDIKFHIKKPNITEEVTNSILNFINNMKKFTNEKYIFIRIVDYSITIKLKFNKTDIKKIKDLPDYQDWLDSVSKNLSDYKEKVKLKKFTNKYNL